jgi:hypothetical protein
MTEILLMQAALVSSDIHSVKACLDPPTPKG